MKEHLQETGVSGTNGMSDPCGSDNDKKVPKDKMTLMMKYEGRTCYQWIESADISYTLKDTKDLGPSGERGFQTVGTTSNGPETEMHRTVRSWAMQHIVSGVYA